MAVEMLTAWLLLMMVRLINKTTTLSTSKGDDCNYMYCVERFPARLPFLPLPDCFLCILGTVWSWGDGDYGKLGHGGSEGCKTPKVIDKLQTLGVARVFCGSQFSMALTRDGQVLTWYETRILFFFFFFCIC